MMLSLLAGYVDSIGFLKLGGYFVSFMSGNTTRLGIDLGEGKLREAVTVFGFVCLFVVGVFFGSLIAHRHRERRRSSILLFVSVLLTIAVINYAVGWTRYGTFAVLLAMGAENTVLRRDGVSVGLTYMTGNLVKMGHALADAFTGRGPLKDVFRYASLWCALATGATLGAFIFSKVNAHALWLAIGLAGFMGFAALRRERIQAQLEV